MGCGIYLISDLGSFGRQFNMSIPRFPSRISLLREEKTLAINRQHNTIKEAGIQVTGSFQTGHSPFLSEPKETAVFIRWVIGEYPGTIANPIDLYLL